MNLLYINWMSPKEDGSKLWIEACHNELRRRGHSVELTRLQGDCDTRNIVLRRFVMLWRMVNAIMGCGRTKHTLVVQYPYCFSFLAPLLKLYGGYILDTTDTQHLREVVALNGEVWYKRIVFHMHYWSWRVWLRFADKVRCNTHHVADMAGGKAIVLYDLLIDGMEMDEHNTEGQHIVGCLCSPGTERWMDEYIHVFREMQQCGVVFEFMGGTIEYAERAGAKHVPWTPYTLRHTMHRWRCGLALLPSMFSMPGKLHGKIIQYMAAGIPVVASEQGETPYLLRGIDNFITRNAADVKQAIEYCCRFPDTAKKTGMLGYVKSREWTIDKCVNQFEKWMAV